MYTASFVDHIKNTIFILFFSIYSATLSAEAAEPYKSSFIKHVRTETVMDKVLVIENGSSRLKTPVTISYEVGKGDYIRQKYTEEYIKNNFALSHMIVMDELKGIGVTPIECRSPYELHIFILHPDTMYSSNLFQKFREEYNYHYKIHAFFDATVEVKGHNNILLSDMGDWENYQSIQHEHAHYWWLRYCLKKHYPSSEDFARLIERKAETTYNEYF